MITKFDKATCTNVSKDALQAAKDALTKLGLTVNLGRGTFSDNKFTLKLEITCKTADGKSARQVEFERYAQLFGLAPTDYGKEFIAQGSKRYKIVGIKMSSRKYPILVECGTAIYKMSAEIVKLRLGATPA